MLSQDDDNLTTKYYRLRRQHIHYQHILKNYNRYGTLAPILARFSSLCHGFVHDLGNGLNSIRGKLVLLSDTSSTPAHDQAIAQAVALCDSCGWRLYALPEISPSPPIHPEPVNLPEWIPRILHGLTTWSAVQAEFHSTESRLVIANYDNLLRMVLLEPLLNAFQVLPKGGRIFVSLQRLDTGLAQIEITDTGPGLPCSDPEECFDLRFTTGPHRYGLGLYVARKVTEKHRGTFTLRQEPAQGVRVTIRLPVGNPEPDWDDKNELKLELEALRHTVAKQEQKIKDYQATCNLPHEQMLAQLSNLFGQLGASTVHFLETGLAGIRRALTPLSGQMSNEAADHIQSILEKCDYCNLVLNNARVLDPALTLNPVPCDVNKIASQVVQLITWRAKPQAIQLRLTQTAALSLVRGDASLIATALMNLLRNAIDAAGQSKQSKCVDVQTLSSDDAVIIRLSNTGDAIPPDAQTRIFDLDYSTRPNRAFGLGLYAAQAIMNKHNGFIAARDIQRPQTILELVFPRQAGGTSMTPNLTADQKDANNEAHQVKLSIAALQDADKSVRQTAVKELGEIGGARAVEPLVAILEDADRDVARAAVTALGQIGDHRAVEPLIAVLRRGGKDVRWDIVRTLELFDVRQARTELKKYKIRLVVHIDDEPELTQAVKLMLKNKGFDVVGAVNGQDGLDTVRKLKPDLVLLDLTLSSDSDAMSGWQVHQCLKTDDELKEIPVIIATGQDQRTVEFLARDVVNVDDFVTKPFGPHELLESVNKVLKLDKD